MKKNIFILLFFVPLCMFSQYDVVLTAENYIFCKFDKITGKLIENSCQEVRKKAEIRIEDDYIFIDHYNEVLKIKKLNSFWSDEDTLIVEAEKDNLPIFFALYHNPDKVIMSIGNTAFLFFVSDVKVLKP